MDRREALLSGLGITLPSLAGLPKLIENDKRFLIVIYLYVGNMSSKSIESFVGRYTKELIATKPSDVTFLFMPQRGDPTYVEVYPLYEQEDKVNKEWFESKFKDIEPLRENVQSKWLTPTNEAVLEYCRLMAGAPVKELPDFFDEYVGDMIEKGRGYGVLRLQAYVWDLCENPRDMFNWRRDITDKFITAVSDEITRLKDLGISKEEQLKRVKEYVEEYAQDSHVKTKHKDYLLQKLNDYFEVDDMLPMSLAKLDLAKAINTRVV
jgi:hypothetical protein